MSFDLYLQHFSDGETAPVDPAPVRQILAKQRHTGPDEFGFYVVEFADGVSVEFSASGLDDTNPFTGCAFHIRGMCPDLVQFVLEIARAADFMIFNCQGDDSEVSPVLIMVSPKQAVHLTPDLCAQFTCRPICASAQQLGSLLFSDFKDWQAYRDKVVGHKP